MAITSVTRGNDFIKNAMANDEFDIYIATASIEKEGFISNFYLSEKLFVCVTNDGD
jgi:hypothetical protein